MSFESKCTQSIAGQCHLNCMTHVKAIEKYMQFLKFCINWSLKVLEKSYTTGKYLVAKLPIFHFL